jgi:acyl-CoA thioester hydrolase
VEWSEGVKSERHVEIRNKESQKIVVNGKTLWCLLDAQSKRPSRIGDDIKNIFH